MFEAISWVLTGETIRGVKDVVNMFTTGGTSVEVHFTVDNDSYKIARYKDHSKFKTDLKIFINGVDKSGKGIRDSQKLLEEYLPDMTSSLVSSVIILGQGLPQRFTNNTPSGRKEVLEKLSKSDFMIQDLKQRINVRSTELNAEKRSKEDAILTANTTIRTLQTQIEHATQELNNLEDVEKLNTAISDLETSLSDIESRLLENSSFILEDNERYKKLLLDKNSIESDISERKSNAIRSITENKAQLQVRLAQLNARINELQREVNKVQSMKDTCPTCGQKLQNVVIPDVTEQLAEIESLRKQYSETSADIVKYTDKQTELENQFREEQKQRTSTVDLELQLIDKDLKAYKQTESSLNLAKTSCERELNQYLKQVAEHDVKVATLQKTVDDNTLRIEELNKELVYYNESKDVVEQRLEVISKFNTAVNRNFRGYLLKNVIEFIDKKAKEYCKDIFETEEISFALEGNNIDIRYCGKQLEVLSGGEQQKINLIVQFAIRDMLCQFLDYRCNLLVLDEIFDQLDVIGCQKVIDLITKKLSDISSILIVTHHSDLAIQADSVITVTKQANGVSSVQ